jgi:hypothetical protein
MDKEAKTRSESGMVSNRQSARRIVLMQSDGKSHEPDIAPAQ